MYLLRETSSYPPTLLKLFVQVFCHCLGNVWRCAGTTCWAQVCVTVGSRNKAVSAKLDGCMPACKKEGHKSSSMVLSVLDLTQSFSSSASGSVTAGVCAAQSAALRGHVDSATEQTLTAGELVCAASIVTIRQCRPPSVRRKRC